jgi:hypothetical protein
VSLSPKAWRVLEILVEHKPKAMAKGALQDLLCTNTFVASRISPISCRTVIRGGVVWGIPANL